MAIRNKNRREFHPAVSIFSWLIVAIAIELASPIQLAWLAAGAAMLLVHGASARRFGRLLWKGRWLWLAMIFIYAWTLPGTLLWPSDYSPSREGLAAGFSRVARLCLMLAALARLLSAFSPAQLAGGLYLLAKPLDAIGLDRRAFAVRLALTLEQIERAPEGRKWLEELKLPIDTAGPEEISLPVAQVGFKDILMLSAALLVLGAVLARAAA